ncbi:MAG: signal recognition particle-docking protein FtsY [archaeon]
MTALFGFLKKAVGGLIDSVKRKLEGKSEEKIPDAPVDEREEKPEALTEEQFEPIPEQVEEAVKEPVLELKIERFREPVREPSIAPEKPVVEGELKVAAGEETLPEPPIKLEETVETITESFAPPLELALEPVREPVREPIETEKEKVPIIPEKPRVVNDAPIDEKKRTLPATEKLIESLREPEPKKPEPVAVPQRKTELAPKKLAVADPALEREGEKENRGFFGKLFGGIKKATETVAKAVTEKTIGENDVSEVLSRFELELIQANVASEVSEKICRRIRTDLVGRKIKRTQDVGVLIVGSLKGAIEEIVGGEKPDFFALLEKGEKPKLIAFIGFNGSGKTTTIAKVAHLLKNKGLTPVIAAGDTFRAAALEQAEIHGERLGVRVIKQQYGADSAAVIFDAVKYAQAHGADVVLADTAGRQHTNSNLMEELRKIVRVNNPDIKILVVDSLSGSDSVLQAKSFDEAVGGLTGVILTKVDVDEKGGTALSVAHTIGKPIFFLGLGQEYSDLKEFDPAEYVKMVLG